MSAEMDAIRSALVWALEWEQEQHEAATDDLMLVAELVRYQTHLDPDTLLNLALAHLRQAKRARIRADMLDHRSANP